MGKLSFALAPTLLLGIGVTYIFVSMSEPRMLQVGATNRDIRTDPVALDPAPRDDDTDPRDDDADLVTIREEARNFSNDADQARPSHRAMPRNACTLTYDKMRREAKRLGIDLPSELQLSQDAWANIAAAGEAYFESVAGSKDRVSRLVLDIVDKRLATGQMVQRPSLQASSTQAARRERAAMLRAERPGQIVVERYRDGVSYIIRINPGDDADVDALYEEQRMAAYMMVDAVNTIISRENARVSGSPITPTTK